MRPVITETMHLSTQAAADELNRRGMRTASGKQWYPMQVLRARVQEHDLSAKQC
jgi:hypothetical protein